MSVVSLNEFAILCGYERTSQITTYISRKKIIIANPEVKTGKLVDTKNIVNKMFLDKAIERNKLKKFKAKDDVVEAVKELVAEEPVVKRQINYNEPVYGTTKKETATQKKQRQKQNKESKDLTNLELRKKKAEVLKVEREAEIKLLDIIKKNGEALPTDFVILMMKTLIREVLTTFDSSTIRIASTFCDRVGADRKMLAEVNEDLSHELQKIIDKAKIKAMDSVNVAIKEYSIQKGRGERELK